MPARTAIPTRALGDSSSLHLADHLKLHAEYNKFAVALAKTTSYTLVAGTDGLVTFDGASLTATLPDPAGNGGETFIIKNLNASLLTVATTASTIDGGSVKILKQFDSIRVTSNDTYWVAQGGISSAFQSTVGLGTPTTAGRAAGDMHYDAVAGREYTLVTSAGTSTWQSTSGAVNSSASALPGFTGRVPGDHAFNTTEGKDYVLTGTPGVAFTDSFSGADGALTTTESGGLTYSAHVQGMAVRVSNQATGVVSAYRGALANVASGTAQEISADVTTIAASSEVHLMLRASSNGSSGYDVSIESNRIKIGRGAITGSALLASVAGAPAAGRYTATVDSSATAPTINVYRNGVLVVSFTDSTGPQTGTYIGFGFLSNTSFIDNVSGFAVGTLAWTVSQPAAAAGVNSSTGFGLPTTTGRTTGDLHYDRGVGRQYELVAGAWALSGGTTNTVGAGLPGFAGRLAGDHAYDTTAGKDYALTGTAAVNFGDDFARADVNPLTVDSAGAAYKIGRFNQSPAIVPKIVSGTVKGSTGTSGQAATIAKNIGNQTTPVTLSAKFTQAASVSATGGWSIIGFTFASPDPSAAVARTDMITVRISLNSSGTDVASAVATYFDGAGSSTDFTIVNSAGGQGIAAGASAVYSATLAADRKTVSLSRNNVLLGTTVVTAAVTGAHYGAYIQMAQNEGTESMDDLSIIAAGTLAWSSTQPTAPTSTTGFGLPTTTGRTNGDLHYDTQGQRSYELVAGAWTPTAGAVNTTGSGLPTFAGRVPGDHHFETGSSRDYVLTGVAGGNTATDTFTRTGTVNGSTTESGGYTWQASAQSNAPISGNQVVCDRLGLYGSLLALGSTAQSVQFSFSIANGGQEQAIIRLRASAANNDGYAVAATNGGTDGGIAVFSAGSGNGSPAAAKLAQLSTASITAGGTLQADINAAGLITVRFNGAVVGTYQTDNSKVSTNAGFAGGGGFAGAVTNIDNIVILNPGTLAWALSQPILEGLDVQNSGSAFTVKDPVTTGVTTTRLTLNAATPTITLPAPAAGKSFTLDLVQDGTGGRAPTWATPSGTIKWSAGAAPTVTATAGKEDTYTFLCTDGVNWKGYVAGQNF